MGDLLSVRVVTPNGLIYSGKALSVSSTNSAGNFDILPLHANFITFIQNKPLIIRDDKNKIVKLDLQNSIIYTKNNLVNIYTEIPIH